jgi:hypothetical protein
MGATMSEYKAIVYQSGHTTRITFKASSLDDANQYAARIQQKLARKHGKFNPVTVEVAQ